MNVDLQQQFLNEIADFLDEWNGDDNSLLVHTSGSTGKPKPFMASKERMRNSALLTCDFLGLKPGDTALLCMPLKYIAGKMVVVRSLVRDLRIVSVAPCGHPLADVDEHLSFAAMTPMQVYNTLQVPLERERLMAVDNLIIGGGAIDSDMAEVLKAFPNRVFSTYGMTETLSHIAMRRLSGSEASGWYQPMQGVSVSLSSEGTLVIDAPLVSEAVLYTNDIAEVDSVGRFRIIGRRDNTINSGGVKVQIEDVETLLHNKITTDFAITSVPDAKFGEIIVLLVSGISVGDARSVCSETLPHLWNPKVICEVPDIPHTATGKIDRASCKRLASEHILH